ncbi:serine/threonine protein kinase [Bacillus wiedmannii]|uniref:non-specific serine/threonine protein kinase n=1 Tax=Bacillus wiedmannii TaxID=1890302 RepID=A0ABD6TFS6_9BACI|nr:serine/threonine protein kinase [Bacillus wiedmannii]PGC75257.1 serine/threonine protein kinase [Bacillus wiedmannii]PHG13103.1 serine/threonine protein kinase [Bacillus wiedmannii]
MYYYCIDGLVSKGGKKLIVTNTLLQLQIQEEIGHEGRNSTVNKAFDPQLNALFVVKKIPKSDFSSADEYFQESQMLYGVQHPNIVPIRYASQDQNTIYLTMEYLEKGSLNKMLNERSLTVREVIKYSLEFLSGIHYMHTKNLVHFDIKPTNILINNAGKAVVTDFGLSRYLNEQGFAYPDKFYCLHAPIEAYDPSLGGFSLYSDIYQAGATIYRMCNGNTFLEEQFDDLNISDENDFAEALKAERFPKKDAFLPHIPLKLRNIVRKSLSLDPAARHETILDMINEISIIDENLDWSYNIITNEHSEFVRNEENCDYTFKIVVTKQGDNHWKTEGFKVRNLDGKSTRVTKWNSNGYTSKKEAFQALEKLLKV